MILLDSDNIGPLQRKTVAFFCPNAHYPPRDGGSLRSIRLFQETVNLGFNGFIIGANFILEYNDGVEVLEMHENIHRSKAMSALKSLMFAEHYIRAKQFNPRVVHEFLTRAARLQPDFVFMSYLFSIELLPYLKGSTVCIDTHNNDWDWFNNLKKKSKNPVRHLICHNSIERTNQYVRKLTPEVTLLHVSESDLQAYHDARPDVRHLIIPNGCDLKPRLSRPDYHVGVKKLLFVGSLCSQMNQDALQYFHERYWPELKGCAELIVVGSKPPKSIVQLCNSNGWTLLADASDEQLDEVFEVAHMVIMPFPYGAGTKLKLSEASGRLVPVLTTEEGVGGLDQEVPRTVKVSNEPAAWRKHIQQFVMTDELEEESRKFANRQAWPISAKAMVGELIPDAILEEEPLKQTAV